MGTFTIIASIIAVILVGLILWRVFTPSPKTTDAIDVLKGSISGKESKSFPGSKLSRSFNQKEGATFTYTGWILVKDFTYNYGQKRVIFTKGDCPGLYLDTTSNSLLVVMNTYANAPETILISNITANKWIHFAIVVDQDSVDIYINGVIRQHHTLLQLPKQNGREVQVGSSGLAGWDGVLAELQYTPRSLSPSEISELTLDVPKNDLTVPPSGPQYYDLSWYTGRT
jgi:hypothetical protein